jgi:SAM-dependent methyltransferase
VKPKPLPRRPSAPRATALLAWLVASFEARQIAAVDDPDPEIAAGLLQAMPEGGALTLLSEDAGSLAMAREALEKEAPSRRVRTIPGSVVDILGRLSDDGYDMVALHGRAVRDRPVREEVLRILRPGGVLVYVEPAQDEPDETAPLPDLGDDGQIRSVVVPLDRTVTLIRIAGGA